MEVRLRHPCCRGLAYASTALILDDHDAAPVPPVAIGPDLGCDEIDGIDDVLRPVVADLSLRALRGVAADRQRRVEQQVEPVDRLLDARAALRPDGAEVAAGIEDALHP